MRIETTPSGSIRLQYALGIGTRLVFAAFSVLPLLVPYYFWSALFPLSAIGLAFWFVSLACVALGVLLLGAMAFAPEQTWMIESGRLIVERRSILGTRRLEKPAAEVRAVRVRRYSWTEGDDSYCLLFETAGGPIETASDGDRKTIDDLAAQARRLLALG